jgi:thiazole synthase ThiGH ThiG subunit
MSNVRSDKPFVLAGRTYQSRLLVGTGKYRDMEETRLAIEASGAEIVTVAVRRTNLGQNAGEPNLLDVLSPDATPSCRTPPAATTRSKPCAPAAWPVSCSMATTW